MSVSDINWAMRQRLPPTPRLLLIILADRANSDTGMLEISIRELSRVTGIKFQDIIYYLEQLQLDNYMIIYDYLETDEVELNKIIGLNFNLDVVWS